MTEDEAAKIFDDLVHFYDEPVDALRWLMSEQKLLGGRKAIDCPYEEVARLIDQLKSGAFV